MSNIEKIKELLRNDMIIPVVGAGVSYATAGLPGWRGLIENGLAYADQKMLNEDGAIEKAQQLLNKGELTKAADLVKKLLNAPNHPFSTWLNDLLGRPDIKSTSLLESIQNLCTPIIATTNYDELITSAGAWQTDRACDWKEHELIQTYLADGNHFVLHLHGRFRRPETPIFSADDYRQLEEQRGYKSILERLWTSKHFLFIGCSKEGVLDPDFSTVLRFMQKWFPSYPHTHYILMKDDEIAKGVHIDLLKKHNIHTIPFGKDYAALPNFINRINPNADRLEAIRQQWSERFGRGVLNILSMQTRVDKSEAVDNFLKESLGSPYYWIGNERLKIMEDALRNYNGTIVNKRDRFKMYQTFIKGLVNVSELREKIGLWTQYWNQPEKLNNPGFIKLAMLAYENLERFPKDLLEDVRHRNPYAIHPYFFDGMLGSFVRGYNGIQQLPGIDVIEFYNDDKYFFENLKRIIDSLKGVLELSAEELFVEANPAQMIAELPDVFFITWSSQEISIRDMVKPFTILAKMPMEKNVKISDVMFVHWRGKPIIVGRTSRFCFYWNPISEIFYTIFFVGDIHTAVHNMKVYLKREVLIIEIYCGLKLYIFEDFVLKKEDQLLGKYSNYTRIELNGRTYCSLASSPKMSESCVFEYLGAKKYAPLLTALDIWISIKETPQCLNAIEEYQFEYPFLREVNMDCYRWNKKEVIGIQTRFDFFKEFISVIQIYDPLETGLKLLFTLLLVNNPCSYFDLISDGKDVHLACGFYDHAGTKKLVQFFQNINRNNLIVASSEPGAVDIQLEPRKIQDICCIKFANPSRILAIDEHSKLYDIQIPTMHFEETELEKGISKIMHFRKTL